MVQWNDEVNSKLLKAIITKAKLTGADYEYFADVIGDGCTPKAVRNHVSRLVNGKGGSTATPDSSPAKLKSPNGKGRAAGKTPTKKRKVESIYESEVEETIDTPKKIKAEKETIVKEEEA